MASASQSLMLLSIVVLLVSGTVVHASLQSQYVAGADGYTCIVLLKIAGAGAQVQPGHCTRSNLSQSGLRCTPNDACHAICDKLKGKDGKCEDGACMCTFCSPSIPSKRLVGAARAGADRSG